MVSFRLKICIFPSWDSTSRKFLVWKEVNTFQNSGRRPLLPLFPPEKGKNGDRKGWSLCVYHTKYTFNCVQQLHMYTIMWHCLTDQLALRSSICHYLSSSLLKGSCCKVKICYWFSPCVIDLFGREKRCIYTYFVFVGGRGGGGRFWFVFACVRAGVTSCACMRMWQSLILYALTCNLCLCMDFSSFTLL